MKEINQISDVDLNSVVGGSLCYKPDAPGAQCGVVGIDGNYTHRYDSESAVTAYIQVHYKDKVWSCPSERDQYLLNGLIAAGLVY